MSPIAPVFLLLSVTLSSPLLAANILFRAPIPIPAGLFDTYADPPSVVMRSPSPTATLSSFSREYKRSASVTIVEGRRSGDIWVANGDAVDGRNKIGRVMGLLRPNPKLAVLPTLETPPKDEHVSPPLPVQIENCMPSVPHTPQSDVSTEMSVMRHYSEASSYHSSADESAAFATQIMVAQRHYSALATTMVLPPSPVGNESMEQAAATGVQATPVKSNRESGHLRARSMSSMTGARSPISPPPSAPLPPTPPSLKNLTASYRLTHRKSTSSSVYSFGAIDTTAEIDALSAGILPLLVPGLKMREEANVRSSWRSSAHSAARTSHSFGGRTTPKSGTFPLEMGEFASEFSPPEVHSTPAVPW